MLVMEICRMSLKDYIYDRANPINFQQMLAFLNGIAVGMKYLHRNKVIHRDLKLGNVLLNDDLTAKVTDFGGSVVHTTRQQQMLPCPECKI